MIDYYLKDSHALKWYYDIEIDFQTFEAELADDTFYYYALLPDTQRKTLTFSDIQSKQPVSPAASSNSKFLFPGITTTNPSPDFWPEVDYHFYTIKTQNSIPQIYIDHIQQKLLADGLNNIPVIITDTWKFDFDKDGHNEAFIMATNRLSFEETLQGAQQTASPSQLAAKDGLGYYSYVTFYSQTFAPMEFETVIEPISEHFYPDDSRPYKKPEPLYQFDLNHVLPLFDIFIDRPNCDMIQPFIGPVICDLNGDGLYDFFTIHGGVYAPCKLYLQNTDGRFILIGGYHMSA